MSDSELTICDDKALAEMVLSEEKVFSGRLLHVSRQSVRLPNGRNSTREMIRHPGAAVIVTLDDAGNVLLERQWRAPLGRAFWEVPAGKLDPDETPDACARRELREETGLSARKWVFLGTVHNAIGYSDEHLELYFATDLESGSQQLDDNEFLSLVSVPLEKAYAMTLSGQITDVKTIIALQWLRLYLKGELPQARELA